MTAARYSWPSHPRPIRIDDGEGHVWEGEELLGRAPRHQSCAEFALLRGLVRREEVQRLLDGAARALQLSLDRGSSMAPDSVDGVPTLWHFFIEHGRYTGELEELLRPIVRERLEPYARQRYGEGTVVCHCFLRRYLPEERRGLGAHFDHHAYVTAVVGLNPEDFEGGLFIQGEARSDRKFVDLEKGDVLFHQYNLHHGVDVTAGSRYSLVFWLMDSQESCSAGTVPWYQRSAEAGDSDAQHLWASCLVSGEHSGRSRPDLASAIPWFERAVSQGNVEAMNIYAAILWERGGHGDDTRALALWTEASELGYAKAQGNLGGLLCTGADGRVPRDYGEGLRLLRSAAQHGEDSAAMKLASHLRRAGLPEAVVWLERCAERGNPDACIAMAEVHLHGELGVKGDPSAVVLYTRWASNLGRTQATANLGTLHARGDFGLPVDMVKAAQLWQKAAAHGDPDALMNLALCYLHGDGGMPRDLQRALTLCQSAASQGQSVALQMQLDIDRQLMLETTSSAAEAGTTADPAWESVD